MIDYRRQLVCGNQSTIIRNHQSIISNHIREFFRRQEAGAGLGSGAGHLVVTSDEGLRELLLELYQQGDEGAALRDGAGVLGLAVGIQAAFVADSDGAAVEGTAVGAYFIEAAVLGDGAVTADVVVVAYVDEASLQVVVLELLGGVVAGFAGGGAVDDDEAY